MFNIFQNISRTNCFPKMLHHFIFPLGMYEGSSNFFESSSTLFIVFFFFFSGPHPQHMEVPSLGVKSALQLLAHTTAPLTWVPNNVYNLHHSSWQHQVLNPLIGARDRTSILMDTDWVHYC